jgi:hypothetical protein
MDRAIIENCENVGFELIDREKAIAGPGAFGERRKCPKRADPTKKRIFFEN